jgi:hypothetical protein
MIGVGACIQLHNTDGSKCLQAARFVMFAPRVLQFEVFIWEERGSNGRCDCCSDRFKWCSWVIFYRTLLEVFKIHPQLKSVDLFFYSRILIWFTRRPQVQRIANVSKV